MLYKMSRLSGHPTVYDKKGGKKIPQPPSFILTFTDSIVVAKDSALLDNAEMLEHGAHLVLPQLLGHHANEQFSLWKYEMELLLCILYLIKGIHFSCLLLNFTLV